LNNGNLYVLDSISRAIWVFVGNDSVFVDTPYFYFANQIPNIDDVIDMAANGDDLYLLHPNGSISFCTLSRIPETPTRCQDISKLNYPSSFKDTDLLARAHITQMVLSAPPDPFIYLLDTTSQGVLRVAPRSMELQEQFRSLLGDEYVLSSGSITAMSVGFDNVLYFATGDQIYTAQLSP
jgi:hypothetical protein